jgi:hypothetical protein
VGGGAWGRGGECPPAGCRARTTTTDIGFYLRAAAAIYVGQVARGGIQVTSPFRHKIMAHPAPCACPQRLLLIRHLTPHPLTLFSKFYKGVGGQQNKAKQTIHIRCNTKLCRCCCNRVTQYTKGLGSWFVQL